MELLKAELQAFDPGHPDFRRKLWVRVVTPDRVYWHVFWKRVAAALALLALIGWMMLTGAAWTFLKYQRGYADAPYFDLVFYPWRANEFRAGLARHYLAAGRKEIEGKNYRLGYALLIAGLNRVPDDLAARRSVAEMQVRYGFVHRAVKTLEDGLPFHPDLPYHAQLFALLLESKEDERAVALAKSLLPSQPDNNLLHQFIALQMAHAHFERGRYDAAEQIIADWRLGDALEGQIVLAKCDWERGFTERSVQRLAAQIPRFPKRDEHFLYLIRFQRALGRHDEARRYALRRYLNDQASPGPRIDLLQSYHATDDRAAEAREIENYLRDFGTNQAALGLLTWFALATIQPELLERVDALAREQGFPPDRLDLARIQLAIEREDYRTALALAETALRDGSGESKENLPPLLRGLHALAQIGVGNFEVGRPLMQAFVAQARLRAADALYLAKQLRLVGAFDESRLVLDAACALDPLNQATLAELVRLDAEMGNRAGLTENLPKLLRVRKPVRAALEEALLHLDRPEDAPLRETVRTALTSASATPVPG